MNLCENTKQAGSQGFAEKRHVDTNIDRGSTITTQLGLFYHDKELATGTGFFYQRNDQGQNSLILLR